MRNLKILIFSSIQILLLSGVSGQVGDNTLNTLKQKFINYCNAVPREEIYVHTDRNAYITGEKVWFSVYLIDRQTFRASNTSRIAYLELLGNNNRPLIQKRIQLTDGTGPGQITLPDTLKPGEYTIRAYTAWMKNFLPENCFVKRISVYNPLNDNAFRKLSFSSVSVRSKIIKGQISVETRSDSLLVRVSASDQMKEKSNRFYLIIQTHGNIDYAASGSFIDKNATIRIVRNSLHQGINQITLFDSEGKPVAERYILSGRNSVNSLKINSDDSCGLRGRVSLKIDGFTSGKNPPRLSVSVAPASVEKGMSDINDFLLFGSEFGSDFQDNNKLTSLSDLNTDSLLAETKSNWIDWESIVSGELPVLKYKHETDEHYIFGKLIASDKSLDVEGQNVIMCIPGKEASFQYARTDPNGNFRFRIHAGDPVKDLVFMPDNGSDKYKVLIESPFSDRYFNTSISADSSVIPAFVDKLGINHQVEAIYNTQNTGKLSENMIAPRIPVRFYGKPDIELVLSDYISLPVMSEVIFELLPGVSLKKRPVPEISISYHINDNLYNTLPCLMIDGVIIKNASFIADLDPENVERIDVIREKYLVGNYIFPGIMNVITKAADFSSVTLPAYMLRMQYRIFDLPFIFTAPNYSLVSVRENRLPDYRNTLYWNPGVSGYDNGTLTTGFWSSDNKADYIIDIQGFDDNGQPVALKRMLHVR